MDTFMGSLRNHLEKPNFVRRSITILKEQHDWIRDRGYTLSGFVREKIMEEVANSPPRGGKV